VIDGATCNAIITAGCGKTALLTDNYGPSALDVDLATDTVYALNNGSGKGNTVSVLDGATCNGTDTSGCDAASPTVTVGTNANWEAVDQATGAVYVSSYDAGTISVIDGTRCNATNTSGCTSRPRSVPVGAGLGGVAVDDTLHTVFAVSQNDATLSAINTNTCNGIATSGCANQPPSERAGADLGAAYNAFPNSVTLLPETDTAYLVSAGGSNILAVVSVSGCNAINISACRTDSATVPDHEFEASIDAATDTIYASNYNLPEIDVLNGATCDAAHLSGCGPVAEIPMPDPMAAMGAIDDATHTLYAAESFRTTVAVINIANCNAIDTAGCSGQAWLIHVGAAPGSPVLNTASRTLYLPFGTASDEIAVVNAATCNAEDISGCGQKPGVVNVGPGTKSLAVSMRTDTIYAPSPGVPFATGTTMSVISGATCNGTDHLGCGKVAATVTVGLGPYGVAVDDATNTVYVANNQGSSAPGTLSIINDATCNGHTTTGCSALFPTIEVGRGPQLAVADTGADRIYIADNGGAGISMLNGVNCNARTTSGCSTAATEQAVGSQPIGLALNLNTHAVYVMTFLVSASMSILAGRP
jgi:DNA-binding beta-propeller fold protein YncE